MLDKFRQNFPTKSLVSEFLGINNGVYAVQCRIVGDGLTLNAIASGSTVEDAEDKARDRVLKLFFAGEAITTPIEYGSHEEKASFSIVAKQPPSDELLAEFKEAIAVEPPAPITEEQPPKKRSPKKKEPEPVESVTETAIAEPEVIELTLPEKEDSSNVIAQPEPEPIEVIPSPEPVKAPALELTAPTPQLELISPPSFEPIDFSDVIAKTTKHMARLKWSNEQGKNYLIATYNKKSRQLLSDEELLEFLQYLESQPDPS